MSSVSLRNLCSASLTALHQYAGQDGLPPVCFALVDAQGDLLCFERMDQAPVRTISIAIAKAYTAARMGCSTLQFRQRLQQEQLQCRDFMDDKLCALPGGVIVHRHGQPFVAIGVSGRALADDEQLAQQLAAQLTQQFT